MHAFKIPQAIVIRMTGNSRITPLAYSRQPISEGSAIMNKITARIFASPQATLNINRIEPKNIQQNKTSINNSNIFIHHHFWVLFCYFHLNAETLCIFRSAFLLFQQPDC